MRKRIHRLEELSLPELDGLSRDRTVFFVTFGNLEVHGPHLPLGTDFYVAGGLRDGLIRRMAHAYPDYDLVTMPVVPLGEGGVEELAGDWNHAGSFTVRYKTLRDVAIDLGSEIARKGFKIILLIQAHGGLLHNVAFSEAASFVSSRYETRMVNVGGIVFADGFYAPGVMARHMGSDWEAKTGIFHHGGAPETAQILHLQPDLLKSNFRGLSPVVAQTLPDVLDRARAPNWQGYWGAPAAATEAMGEDFMNDFVERAFRVVEMVVAGKDISGLPAYPGRVADLPEEWRRYVMTAEANYDAQEAEIDRWLEGRSKPPL